MANKGGERADGEEQVCGGELATDVGSSSTSDPVMLELSVRIDTELERLVGKVPGGVSKSCGCGVTGKDCVELAGGGSERTEGVGGRRRTSREAGGRNVSCE